MRSHHHAIDSYDREHQRLAVLDELELLDTPPEREFEVLIELTQRMLDCKIVLVSLVAADRQWFKARCGLDVSETSRDLSFCSYAIQSDEPFIVPDAAADPRFAANSLVLGPPYIRFYAGVPLQAKTTLNDKGSIAIGTICIIDDKPRQISADDLRILRDCAKLVEALINARSSAAEANRLAEQRQLYIRQLNREHLQFSQAERMAKIGSWRLALADDRIEWSDQIFVIHDLPHKESPSLDAALAFYPPHDRDIVSATVARTVQTGQPFELETDFITAKGAQRRVRSKGELEFVDGKPVALIGVFQDITAQYQMEQSLRRVANTDDLTQIPNRAKCGSVLEELITRAKERQEALALLLIDLDHFKVVNDRFGHAVGDNLLRLIASRLQAPYLSRCFVARLGGDEFVLVVSAKEDCDNLDNIVQSLLSDLRHSFSKDGNVVHVSGTIGISWLDDTVQGRSELLLRADTALYSAKQRQRGSAEVFVPEKPTGSSKSRHLSRKTSRQAVGAET